MPTVDAMDWASGQTLVLSKANIYKNGTRTRDAPILVVAAMDCLLVYQPLVAFTNTGGQ